MIRHPTWNPAGCLVRRDYGPLWVKVTVYFAFGNYAHPSYAISLSVVSSDLVGVDTGTTSFDIHNK
jgi:hypothetical protein